MNSIFIAKIIYLTSDLTGKVQISKVDWSANKNNLVSEGAYCNIFLLNLNYHFLQCFFE